PRAAGPGPAGGRDRRHRRRGHPPHAARRAGARAAAARRARGDHDARPRRGLRAVRRGPAAAAAPGQHRADRLGRQMDALPGSAGRRRARPGGDRPDHLPDRPARDHRQGPGRDRGRGRRRAAVHRGRPRRRDGGIMTIYAATVVDTPGDPFTEDPATALAEDGALLVRDGVIRARGSLAELRAAHPGEPVTRLDGGLPLLDWLERYALPEECKLADRGYAWAVAGEFTDGLVASGTTSALVFGSHFAPAMDELFAAAGQRGLNITSGLVLSDRKLPPDLLHSPETALADSADLILRWHDRGRLRYAVTPRFSLSTSDEMLDACAQLLGKGVWFTSHINENLAEVETVAGLFPGARHYLDTYCRHGLVTPRSVFAHNVHPGDAELALLAEHGASVAHCPTSNSALGSGLFPLRRHVEHGIGVALGSDVGAGTGLFLPKEALQAYFVQQLLGPAGLSLTPAHLLYLATRAG